MSAVIIVDLLNINENIWWNVIKLSESDSFIRRWNAARINVDMHDAIQSTTSMFHTGIATRMVVGANLYIRRLHLHHNRNHFIGIK